MLVLERLLKIMIKNENLFFCKKRYLQSAIFFYIKHEFPKVAHHFNQHNLTQRMVTRSISSWFVFILSNLFILPSLKSKFMDRIGLCLWTGLAIGLSATSIFESRHMIQGRHMIFFYKHYFT